MSLLASRCRVGSKEFPFHGLVSYLVLLRINNQLLCSNSLTCVRGFARQINRQINRLLPPIVTSTCILCNLCIEYAHNA